MSRELELTRVPGDRRLYALDGVGRLRLVGLFSRSATAEADGKSWQLARRGLFGRRMQATDAAGAVLGEFEPRGLRRGGTIRWAGRELTLRPASAWRERYALAQDDRELAVLHGKGWGQRPVEVTVDDAASIDAGLLLFAVFVVRGLAEDASGAAAGSSSAAVG